MSTLFSVYDSKAEHFIDPFYEQTTASGLRAFEAACNNENHQFCKYAEDYMLYELGTFDNSSAMFKLHPAPIALGLAATFLHENVSSLEKN